MNEATDPDGFFSLNLQLIIDGVAPHLVKEITASRKKVLLQQYECKLDMIMTGVQATQLGESPSIIEQKLGAMF
ncbi:MAG: flagellar motor component MotA [Candidatus Latescibacterota bacterium]